MAQTLDNTTYKIKSFSKSGEYSVKTNEFGDGYNQYVLEEHNYVNEEWSLTWIPMDTTAALELEVLLLNSKNGTDNILSWTPPYESTAKYYTAWNINKNHVRKDLLQISATLKREYPLV